MKRHSLEPEAGQGHEGSHRAGPTHEHARTRSPTTAHVSTVHPAVETKRRGRHTPAEREAGDSTFRRRPSPESGSSLWTLGSCALPPGARQEEASLGARAGETTDREGRPGGGTPAGPQCLTRRARSPSRSRRAGERGRHAGNGRPHTASEQVEDGPLGGTACRVHETGHPTSRWNPGRVSRVCGGSPQERDPRAPRVGLSSACCQ